MADPIVSTQPYDFGWPDELVRIRFPDDDPQTVSYPWFYFLTPQLPTYFQYLGEFWGNGWQAKPFLPIIKILPIDTQPLTPTSVVGFSSIEEAIDRTNAGQPISQDAWGRFNFKNKFFWDVLGRKYPTWASFRQGLPKSPAKSQQRNIRVYIREAVEDWHSRWNADSARFNRDAVAVSGDGNYGLRGPGSFAIPFPPPATPLPVIQNNPGMFYFGAIPPFAIFQQGQALIWKQSFSFAYAIAQLDKTVWDMSVFPPRRAVVKRGTFGSIAKPSGVSGKYGGYGGINFPLTVPIIAGTS